MGTYAAGDSKDTYDCNKQILSVIEDQTVPSQNGSPEKRRKKEETKFYATSHVLLSILLLFWLPAIEILFVLDNVKRIKKTAKTARRKRRRIADTPSFLAACNRDPVYC